MNINTFNNTGIKETGGLRIDTIPVSRFNHTFLLVIVAAGILSFLTSLLLLQVFFGLLAVLWLTEKNSEKKKAFDTTSVLFAVLLVTRLLSIFMSPYPETSYQSLYKDALLYLGFFSMSFYFRTFTEEELKKVVLFLMISFLITALTGLIRFNIGAVKRAETFTGGYATFSSYLLAGTGILISLSKVFFLKRIFLFSLLTAFVYTAILTSLGRFNILVAVVLFIAGISYFRIHYKAVIFVILFTAALTYISFLNNSSEAEQRINQPAQLSDRDVIFEGALILWDERPLVGYGPRTFRDIFPLHNKLTDKGVGSWHNDFIQMYFESGIIGLTAFVLLLGFLLMSGIKFTLRKVSGKDYILPGIILALCGLILSALTAGFINSPVLSLFFALLAAFIPAYVNRKSLQLKANGNQGP